MAIIDLNAHNGEAPKRKRSALFYIGAAHRSRFDKPDIEQEKWSVKAAEYAIVEADSAEDALRMYLKARPDLVNDVCDRWCYDKDGQRVFIVTFSDDRRVEPAKDDRFVEALDLKGVKRSVRYRFAA